MLLVLVETMPKSLQKFSLTIWDSKWMITLFFGFAVIFATSEGQELIKM